MTARASRLLSLATRMAALGGVLLLGAPMTARLHAQISPGPLARAHRQLEGPTNCTQCHGPKREPMTRQCLACHREIGWLLDRGRGYHADVARTSRKECAECHPDHAGADFRMIEWPGGAPARFDHRRAGWALEGAHADAKCEACHATRFRTSPGAALAKGRTAAGWTGLETSCVSCHRDDDVHRGELAAQCERCHDVRDWAPAPTFDHARTDYPLTGEHADVKCDACHRAPKLPVRTNAKGERVPVFKPVPFRECSSCHADPHKGSLGATCSDCHVTRGFAVIDRAGFDHDRTDYPLRGRHASVRCESCHGANLARKSPPFATCATCHEDVHAGERVRTAATTACESCHAVAGFRPSTFTVARHARSAYPLDGRHVEVACERCHVPSAPTTSLTTAANGSGARATTVRRVAPLVPSATSCASCHQDAHGGDLVARTDRAVCESCHATKGFAPSTFSVAQHASLRVTLDGRHGAVACDACHDPKRAGLPPLAPPAAGRKARLTLSLKEAECAACHADPHAGRYEPGRAGAATMSTGCTACHDQVRWRPATMTAALHGALGWALEGAHRAVPCVACHAELGAPAASSTLKLSTKGVTPLPFTARRDASCAGCHETPHGAQFASRRDRGACEGCHGVASFAPASRFDHERDAAFSLAGAHATLSCASCHKAATPGAPIAWRPLSTKCESCHASPARGGRR